MQISKSKINVDKYDAKKSTLAKQGILRLERSKIVPTETLWNFLQRYLYMCIYTREKKGNNNRLNKGGM